MLYSDGIKAQLGDQVKLNGDEKGVLVAIIDQEEYFKDLNQQEWGYLKKGVLIRSEKYGLFHYEKLSEDVEFVDRMQSPSN